VVQNTAAYTDNAADGGRAGGPTDRAGRWRSRPSTPRVLGPIAVFYAVTMLGAGLLGQVQLATGINAQVIELVQFGPTLGVLAVLAFWRGRRPSMALGLSVRPGLMARMAAIAVTSLVIFGLCLGFFAVMDRDVHYTHPGDLSAPVLLIVVAQFVGACGEEIGWRCFLQPFLQTRMGAVASSVVVGLLWGVWHVQVFAVGPAFAGAFLLATVAMSIFLAVLLREARGNNLLIAASFHTLINLGLLLLMDEENGSVPAMTTFAVACLVSLLPWVRPGRAAESSIRTGVGR